METSSRIYPSNSQAIDTFRQMALAPCNEKPIVEMNDETSRDMKVIWASIESTASRWRGEKDIYFPGMPMDRKEFWGAFAGDHAPQYLPVVEEYVKGSYGEGKLAIDLGSGNSPAIKDLLQRGWRVIAVDSSRSTLTILEKQFKKEINLGRLSLIENDVTTFSPSESADLVIAADIFPYINPSKFQNLWNRIHDTFIKENGFLIGSFFRVTNATPTINTMKEMGAWFLPDRRMVRPLLTNQGYDIIKCIFRIDQPNNDPTCIQFIAKKLSAVSSK